MTALLAPEFDRTDRYPRGAVVQMGHDHVWDPVLVTWGSIVGQLRERQMGSGSGLLVPATAGWVSGDTIFRLFEATGDKQVATVEVGEVADQSDGAVNPRELIAELRSLSSLTWEQIATVMQTSRRTIHNWAAGKPISAKHRERLSRLVATFRYIDRGIGAMNRELIFARTLDGRTAFELLASGDFDAVRNLCGPGKGRAPRNWTPVDWADLEKYAPPSLRSQMEQWATNADELPTEADFSDDSAGASKTTRTRRRLKIRRR